MAAIQGVETGKGANLHPSPAHPLLVDGEGSRVVPHQSHRGVEQVELQLPDEAGARLDDADEVRLEQLVAVVVEVPAGDGCGDGGDISGIEDPKDSRGNREIV